MPREWENLNVKQKIMFVTDDIVRLLNELHDLTEPEGELYTAIQKASESFEPIVELLGINLEDGDENLNVGDLSSTLSTLKTPELNQERVSPEPEPSRLVNRGTRTSDLRRRREHLSASRESESSAEDQRVKPQRTSGSHTKKPMGRVENLDRLSSSKGGNSENKLKDSDAMNNRSEKHIVTGARKEELQQHGPSSLNFSNPGPSGLQKGSKKSDSKRTSGTTSVYESYIHYSEIKQESSSDDESEEFNTDSSTVY